MLSALGIHCIVEQCVLKNIVLFSGTIYTAGTSFTRSLFMTVTTNLNSEWSGKHHRWSGKHHKWSGKHHKWSGKHHRWSGQHQRWSGKHLKWAEPFSKNIISHSYFQRSSIWNSIAWKIPWKLHRKNISIYFMQTGSTKLCGGRNMWGKKM